jgi:hypothetical protein
MKKVSLVFVLLLIFAIGNAQKNFRKGLLVLKNGDTLQGWIDYRNWHTTPRIVNYKEDSLSETIQPFYPQNLALFRITGLDEYRSAIVKKEMSPVAIGSLTQKKSNTEVVDTVFLRTLVRGKVLSLFEHVDFKHHYYIQDSSNEYVELVYKRFLNNDNEVSVVNIYRNQLYKFAIEQNADKKLIRKIESISYNEEPLTAVVTALNRVLGEPSYTTSYNKKNEVVFFAGAGGMYSSLRLGNIDFDYKAVPFVKAGVDIFSQRGLQNLLFRFELSYNNITYEGEGILYNYTSRPGYDTATYVIKQQNIAPAVSILYFPFVGKQLRCYVGIDYTFNFSSYKANTFTSHGISGAIEDKNFIELEDKWAIINAKAGIICNRRFELGVSRNIGGNFVAESGVFLRPSVYAFWVNYRFVR